MTVTNMLPPLGGNADPTEALVGRIRDEIIAAIATPNLSAVHEVIREAGIRNARRALAEAPDRMAEAQAGYREAQAVESAAKAAYAQALVEAEWELDGHLHKDGNKTYRWVPCECVEAGAGDKPGCPLCTDMRKLRRFMLADDVKSWKAAEATKVPAVVTATLDLREAEEVTAAARDAVGIADRRFSAAKYDLTAAVAELNALAVGLSSKEITR